MYRKIYSHANSIRVMMMMMMMMCQGVDSTVCAENPLYDFLSRCKFSTRTSTLLYSSISRLYPQNPEKSVKVYLPMYNGNVLQNPLCVESCVTKKFSTSPLFSSTIFDPDANSVPLRVTSTTLYSSKLYAQETLCTIFYQDANSVLLLAHFCTAVLLGSIHKTLCLKLFMMRA